MNQEFNDKSQKLLETAQSKAIVSYHQELSCKHLLAAMLEDNGFLHFALTAEKIPVANFKMAVDNLLKSIPQVKGGQDKLSMQVSLSRVLSKAKETAGSSPIQEADILIAMSTDAEQEVVTLLKNNSLSKAKLLALKADYQQRSN